MTVGIPKPCLDHSCGELTLDGYCPNHKPKRRPRKRTQASATARGYGYGYQKLRNEAVRLQPWCYHCNHAGSQDNPLTVDHSPESWRKVASGKPLTLRDFRNGLLTVLCMRCNIKAGSARGTNITHT